MKQRNDRNQLDTDDQLFEPDTLDTQTTFADMNVEGMPWYDSDKRRGGKESELPALSKSEMRAMIRGALLAALPLVGVLIVVLVAVFGLAYLWLS